MSTILAESFKRIVVTTACTVFVTKAMEMLAERIIDHVWSVKSDEGKDGNENNAEKRC